MPRKNTPRRLTILGSTGSVGKNTVKLIQNDPDNYKVEVLTANTNVELLAQQANETGASLAVVADETKYAALKSSLKNSKTEAAAGFSALLDAASAPVDWVMAAIVGAAGLKPTMSAIRNSSVVALANKECLVCAGEVMLTEIDKSKSKVLPVDSEHNAIFQVFEHEQRNKIEKIILTASGGPFWGKSLQDMKNATPEEAVNHPNWNMGPKISIDSATMMNKGLELIEAYYLFSIEEAKIDVLIHPESIVHSMVSYCDGTILAQLGTPDMQIPISYTLGWPNRIQNSTKRLDLSSIGTLRFEKPDDALFPALKLARHALSLGGGAPAIFNAANEVAVEAFLQKQIKFLDIVKVVECTLENSSINEVCSIDDVIAIDEETRRISREQIMLLNLTRNL
ncbi:MAG: 1-deoxy-D-xylulose-5-phosphate reductoisomerase [Rhodospirillales bacterium]|nr:1-deoxy-D-xylulose-5-phosphate reductoisomerase [Rhodospirillales bacterium]